MAYRPVLLTDRLCRHCQIVFQAKDKRRLYCSSSCNTLACQARKTTKSAKASPMALLPKTDERALPLTGQNVATLVVGAGVVAGLNYLANDRPAHAEIMNALHEIKASLAKLTESTKADQALDYLVRYIDAQRAVDPGLNQRMQEAQQRNQASHQKAAPVSSGIEGLLRPKRKRRRKQVST